MKVLSYDCIDRHHLIAQCPQCAKGTAKVDCKEYFNGIAEANCSESNNLLAFYLIMKERKARMLGMPIEMVIKPVT